MFNNNYVYVHNYTDHAIVDFHILLIKNAVFSAREDILQSQVYTWLGRRYTYQANPLQLSN